jgi:hypothetical protein
MALVGVMQDDKFKNLAGKWVKLTVTLQDYSIEEVDEATASKWIAEKSKSLQKHAANSIDLPHRLEDTGLSEFETLKYLPKAERARSIEYIGAKVLSATSPHLFVRYLH